MSPRLRIVHLPLVAACLCQALAIRPLAHSQAAPVAAQQNQNAQPASQTRSSSSAPLEQDWREVWGGQREDWEGQINQYQDSLESVVDICGQFQRHIDEGKEPDKEPLWWHYISFLRLREDEMQVMCNVFVDAGNRNTELRRQYYAAYSADGTKLHTQERDPLSAKRFAVFKQERTNIEEAIAKLKQVFGEEDFKRLDRDFYRSRYGGISDLKLKYPETPDLDGDPNPCNPWDTQEVIHHGIHIVPGQPPVYQP